MYTYSNWFWKIVQSIAIPYANSFSFCGVVYIFYFLIKKLFILEELLVLLCIYHSMQLICLLISRLKSIQVEYE